MSLEALALRVVLTWFLVVFSGWTLAGTRLTALPATLRCCAIFVSGGAYLACVGAAVIAFDLASAPTHGVFWVPLLCVALLRRPAGSGASRTGHAREFAARLLRDTRITLAPLLLALAFGAHALSVVHAQQFDDTFDWHASSKRSYRLLDSDLQYRVADAFLHDESVEKHFLDGGLVWSAGDRPMLFAVIYTGLARLHGAQNLAHYRLTVILFASIVLVAIHALLRSVIGLPRAASLLITATTALHPFVLANIEYAWPKMSGVAFALGGFVLVVHALRSAGGLASPRNRTSLAVGSLGFALAPLCHATLVVGVTCLLALVALWSRDVLPAFRKRALLVGALLLPTLGLLLVQSAYNANHTRSSQLGLRIALCSEGSALHRTEHMSLGEACSRYFERKGIAGVVADRVANLKRLLLLEPGAFSTPYARISSLRDLQFAVYFQTLQAPLYSAGLLSLPLLLLAALARLNAALRERITRRPEAFAILAAAWLFTFLFVLVMSETSEITSRGVPFTQPVLCFVAACALVMQIEQRVAIGGLVLYALFCLSIHANDEALFEFIPRASLLGFSAVALIAGLATLFRFDSEPQADAAQPPAMAH